MNVKHFFNQDFTHYIKKADNFNLLIYKHKFVIYKTIFQIVLKYT